MVTTGYWGHMSRAPLRCALRSRNCRKSKLLCPLGIWPCVVVFGWRASVLVVTSGSVSTCLCPSSPSLVRDRPLFWGREKPGIGLHSWQQRLEKGPCPGFSRLQVTCLWLDLCNELVCCGSRCLKAQWIALTGGARRLSSRCRECEAVRMVHSSVVSSNPAEGCFVFCCFVVVFLINDCFVAFVTSS